MSTLAPEAAKLDLMFKGAVPCMATFGTDPCKNDAAWKIIMACCGASDFLCNECFSDFSTTPDFTSWFQCHHCGKQTWTWKDAVKEAHRI